MRPLLSVVLVPSIPMNEDRLSHRRILAESSGQILLRAWPSRETRWSAALRRCLDHAGILHREESLGNDDVQDRSSAPASRPRPAASPVDGAAPSASPAVERDDRSKSCSDLRYRRLCCASRLVAAAAREHIIGVSVSDTTAETRIVTLSVTANSRNSRPTMSPMNKQRNQHRDQRNGQRNDRESDLRRALQRGLQRGCPLFDVAR